MSSLDATATTVKPVETIHPDHLSSDLAVVTSALKSLVEHTATHPDVQHGIHAPMHMLAPLVHKLVPGLEDLATAYHVGNFVLVRGTGERFFESMPIYPRLGMHLLYYGGTQIKLLHSKSVESVLKDLSVRQGELYDAPASVKSIPSFIRTYSISLDDLLEPDISKYTSFNDFFTRKLKPDARPVQNSDDPATICSAADCRLVVYDSVDLAKEFWIKGNSFTLPTLLDVAPDSAVAQQFTDASVACFRLAPADYHRFHSPIDGTISEIRDIPGEYYTVNPEAVNEPGFDVFTTNKRSVLTITRTAGPPVVLVAIGAMLVGSITWTLQPGETVRRGQELGYFAYGGSTVVGLWPKGAMQFDEDLVTNSKTAVETLVKVGYSIGKYHTEVIA